MRRTLRCTVEIALVVIGLVMATGARDARAEEGDRAGWRLLTDPRGRAFLTYVGVDNGPRLLTLACLGDVGSFAFYSEDLADIVGPAERATLELSSGPAKFTVPGAIEPDALSGKLGFSAEIVVDPRKLETLAASMRPLLQSKEPMVLAFGRNRRELPPIAGLPDPGKRFATLCFGR